MLAELLAPHIIIIKAVKVITFKELRSFFIVITSFFFSFYDLGVIWFNLFFNSLDLTYMKKVTNFFCLF